MALPKWKSHKIVEGDEIVEIRIVDLGHRESGTDSGQRWVLACGDVITVSLSLISRLPDGYSHQEALGGYYARYEDGFESWSPKKAWVNGYTRLGSSEEKDVPR